MGDSNGEWGELAANDAALASLWDDYSPLPEQGDCKPLDALCARKHITIESLIRQGARLKDDSVLAWAYDDGIKYRDLVTDRRWSTYGATFDRMRVIRHGTTPTDVVFVTEGETDGARINERYPVDVAIMPAGARYFPQSYADALADYEVVLLGLDNDEAGTAGTEKAMALLPQAMPFPPPGKAKDWCEAQDDEFPDLPTQVERPAESQAIVSAGPLLDLEVPETASWLEHDVLPVGGLAIIHGWAKSFKTFLALDLLGRLSTGRDWGGFEPCEEPAPTLVVQYEITWPYYRQRLSTLRADAKRHGRDDLFNANFMTYSPLARPRLRAGDTKAEALFRSQAVEAGAQVVLIDPIRRGTGAIDMNSEGEVRAMLDFCASLQDEGITVIATHHDNKTAARNRGGDPTDMTGSGAWAGDPDTIISIELPPGENHRTSVRRNMNFTLRNSPAIGGRAFEMTDDGIVYSLEPWGDQSDEDPTAPTI